MKPQPAAPVQRPDGRMYRPRKPPRVVVVDNSEDWRGPYEFVYVLGTHNRDQAAELAKAIRNVQEPGERDWIRLAMHDNELRWISDHTRGAAAVIFEVID